MAFTDFWDDRIFASLRLCSVNSTFEADISVMKQSVDKIRLSDTQTILAGEEAPKFRGWDGFFSDPEFAKVTGRQEKLGPGQQREFWKYEVEKSDSTASLFPSLSSSAFNEVSFRQSEIDFWSKPIGNKPAGLEILREAAKPSIRLSTYLGLTPMPGQTYILDGLTLSGTLLGLRIPLPPVLELVTIKTTRQLLIRSSSGLVPSYLEIRIVECSGSRVTTRKPPQILNPKLSLISSKAGQRSRASEALDTSKRKVDLAIQQVQTQLSNAKNSLKVLELSLKGEFERAEREAKEMVSQAQESYDKYRAQQELESEKLKLQLSALKNSTLSAAVTAAEGALEIAKNNNVAFKAAQAGLDAVKTLEGAIYQTLSALIKAAASLCDIRVVKLNGTIKANALDQKALIIHMEGTLVGQEFNFDLSYTPGQTTDFLERLAKRSFEHLKIA
ncbi:hypothetical protein ACLMJK_009595 [Lecanora helva]